MHWGRVPAPTSRRKTTIIDSISHMELWHLFRIDSHAGLSPWAATWRKLFSSHPSTLEFLWPPFFIPFYYFPGTRNSRSAASNCWWNVKRHTNSERCLHAQHLFISAHSNLNTSVGLLGAWAVSYFPPRKEPEMPRIQESVIPPQLTLGYEWSSRVYAVFCTLSSLDFGWMVSPVDERVWPLVVARKWFIRVAALYR